MLTIYATLLSVLLAPTVQAATTCEDGRRHETLAAAVQDLACHTVQLDPGVYYEQVAIDRPLEIRGEGPQTTSIVCFGGPCLDLDGHADLRLTGVAVASDTAPIDARSIDGLHLDNVAVLHLGGAGGGLVLQDSDAVLKHVVFEVGEGRRGTAIDAVSGQGHALTLDDVRFLGTRAAPSGGRAIYTLNYAVACTACTFGGEQEFGAIVGTEIEIDDLTPTAAQAGEVRLARWSKMACQDPTRADIKACATQCGERIVAACTMDYAAETEQCWPVASCVQQGEAL